MKRGSGTVTRPADARSTIRFRTPPRAMRGGISAPDDLAARCVQEIARGDGPPIRVCSPTAIERCSGTAPRFAATVRAIGHSLPGS
jgi:hypothetical protein